MSDMLLLIHPEQENDMPAGYRDLPMEVPHPMIGPRSVSKDEGGPEVEPKGRWQDLKVGVTYGLISSVCNIPSMLPTYSDPAAPASIFAEARMDLGALLPEAGAGAPPAVDALCILKDYLREENLPVLRLARAPASPLPLGVQRNAASLRGAGTEARVGHRFGTPMLACRDDAVATVLVCTALSTAIVGLLLILTGSFRLASLVQYLPMPVVGGYLAYIGLYCIEAAFSIMLGGMTVNEWTLTTNVVGMTWKKGAILCAPGLVGWTILLVVCARVKHFLTLPICLLSIPVLFYIALQCSQTSLSDAQAFGWMDQPAPTVEFYDAFSLFDFKLVQWAKMVSQLPSLFGLYFVVAFGSSLDVAAIEMTLGKKLSYDSELITIGISNLLSGALGGFTGSYLFGQTSLMLRAGVTSRGAGFTIVALELVVILLPISILQFIPRFFFGTVLMFIGSDIMLDWFVHAFNKMHILEYALVWVTFIFIMWQGLELGMALGVGAAMFLFVLQYARAPTVRRHVPHSGVVRSFEERRALEAFQPQVFALRVSGYLFFGSTLQISAITEPWLEHGDEHGEDPACMPPSPVPSMSSLRHVSSEEGISGPGSLQPSSDTQTQKWLLMVEVAVADVACWGQAVRYVVLDLEGVTGVDATAARSLNTLANTARSLNAIVLFAGMQPWVQGLLGSHGAIPQLAPEDMDMKTEEIGDAPWGSAAPGYPFKTASGAMQWLECQMLREELDHMLREEVARFFECVEFKAGELIFEM
eukprot:gene12357-14595_t